MRAGLVKRGAPALLHRGDRFWGRQVCRGTPAAKGDREVRRGGNKAVDHGAQAGEPPTSLVKGTTRAEQDVAPRERLHYFVETEELRRLLCLMAGTELLNELCQRWQSGE